MSRKNTSPFVIQTWIDRGFSEEDALQKVNEIKGKKPNRKEYWIAKGFSEEEAKLKVKECQSRRSLISKEKIKQKFGGQIKSSRNWEFWVDKGFSEEEAKLKVSELQTTFSLDKCIEKYGEQEGTHIWQTRQILWQDTLNSKSEQEKIEINKKKALSLENFISKYGLEIGTQKYIERNKKQAETLSSYYNLDECKSILGDEKGIEMYEKLQNILVDKKAKFLRSSKQATKFFDLFVSWLKSSNITFDYIKYGSANEFKIEYAPRCHYFYDFILMPYKLIIEYNGSNWHPNKNLLTEKQWNRWKHPFDKTINADEAYNKQQEKISYAQSLGYKVLEVWNSESNSCNLFKCIEFINQNLG